MIVQVDVQNATDDDSVPATDIIEAWVGRALAAAAFEGAAEVSVRIVEADEIRVLNSDYRGKDKPTNVLSFPAGEVAGLPAEVPRLLGDIVICAEVVASEAGEQGKVPADHWAHLLVHGTLHLLGFDHESETEAAVMEALETRILRQHGRPDPYGAAV